MDGGRRKIYRIVTRKREHKIPCGTLRHTVEDAINMDPTQQAVKVGGLDSTAPVAGSHSHDHELQVL
jgi:hypothetical protein